MTDRTSAQHHQPSLAALAAELPGLRPHLESVAAVHATAAASLNAEGGDPTVHGDNRLLARHLGHYLAAVEIAHAHDGGNGVEAVLDVGSGTGAFSAWMAAKLDAALSLADHDPDVLAAAQLATGAVAVHRDVAKAPASPLVTAMEVLEHIRPQDQPGFCRAVVGAVAPGGLLVLSTPDESLYPGGWSGYAPHVGCVTAEQLESLLREAGAQDVRVWRLLGGPYDTAPTRRVMEAVGNRAWTLLGRVAPAAPAALERRRGGGSMPTLEAEGLQDVRVVPAQDGAGGSLVAVVRVPA